MLSLLRENAGSWMIKVLLSAIVIVFVFWGVGSYRERSRNRVATVNGKTITIDEYQEAYTTLREQYRMRFGENLNEETIKMLEIDKQALNQLIDQRILLSEAENLDLRISDSELSSAIMKINAFQKAGIFDPRRYQSVLSRNRLTPEKFEVLQRDSMLLNKLNTFITSSSKVSDDEARAFFKWQNALVDIDYVVFEPAKYTDINPSEEEIKAFYEDNTTEYKTDAMVKVRYLNFESTTYTSQITVIDEEIKEYYETYLEKFQIPKTVEARHILILVPRNATLDTIEEKKNKALDILKMAKEGKDFAELAMQYSEGPSGKTGGKLGPFRKESMEKPFSDKAFSMKVGEISEPVRTRYGWHIIKVEKINDASTRPLDDVRVEIKDTLTKEKGKSIAYDEAQDVYDDSFEGDDLVNAAKERDLNILTSDFFTRNSPDKALKNGQVFAEIAFDLEVMDISDILDHGDGYYIFQVFEKKT